MTNTTRPNRYDYLKLLALATMIVDHVGYFLFPEVIWLRVIGRIAFPLFLLLVGFNGSYKRRWSLRSMAIVLQVIIYVGRQQWVIDDPLGNILLAIALTRVILGRTTKQAIWSQISIFGASILLAPSTMAYIDYGTLSLSAAMVGARMHTRHRKNRPFMVRSMVIFVHLFYMIWLRDFPPSTRGALGGVGLLLLVCGQRLHQGNFHISLTPRMDRTIMWIANQALRIYLLHGALLACLARLL